MLYLMNDVTYVGPCTYDCIMRVRYGYWDNVLEDQNRELSTDTQQTRKTNFDFVINIFKLRLRVLNGTVY